LKVQYEIQDKFDFGIFFSVLALVGIGLAAIYSATFSHPSASGNFEKQAFWTIVSLGAFFAVYFLPVRIFRSFAVPIYLLSLILLVLVLFIGKTVYGAQSWLSLGVVGFQPSEFAKIGLILALAYWLTNKGRDINNIKDLGGAIFIGMLPVALIILEPDLGTSIVFIIITLAMIFWSGINLFAAFVVLSPLIMVFASIYGTIVVLIGLALIIGALFFFKKNLFTSAAVFVVNLSTAFFFDYVYQLLQPHQQKRIETFLNPAADPLGAGYNILQAKVAIGSGGLLGKGFLQGNQTQLRFIPEQWTDFIFCVIGEEFGFIGSILTIGLFIFLFLKLLDLSNLAKDRFESLIVVGILTLLFAHFSINIGMNVGVTPVIGLPLPFISYGGSSLLVNMILIGITLNIYKNRKERA
jgi:rod shape determining protein RodA